jgi:hypothetical protein
VQDVHRRQASTSIFVNEPVDRLDNDSNRSSSVSADVRFVSVITAMTSLSVRSTVLLFSSMKFNPLNSRVKSYPPSAGIIRSSPYFPR